MVCKAVENRQLEDSGFVKQETNKVSPAIVSRLLPSKRPQATVQGKDRGTASGPITDHMSIFVHHF